MKTILAASRHFSTLIALWGATAMAVIGLVTLVGVAQTVWAQVVENPQDGSIGLSGVVPGESPDNAPVITEPTNGQSFNTNPIVVRGSCGADLLVQLYRNDIFSGSVICNDQGVFELQMDLINGQNQLIARQFDALNQSSPDSQPVNVTYSPPQFASSDNISNQTPQLLLSSAFGARGVDPGKQLSWPITISGGEAPYAVTVKWGDGQESLHSFNDSGTVTLSHAYERPGRYEVTIKAVDENNRVAFLQLTTIVNGPESAGVARQSSAPFGIAIQRVYITWPLYILATTTVVAFIVGRRAHA